MNFPAAPDGHAIAVMCLTAAALVLFSRERIAMETSALAVLVALTVLFSLFPYISGAGAALNPVDLFHGFGNEALVAVCALMITGQGLQRTGALEPVGRALARLWALSPSLSLLATLVVGALLSALVNNTTIVVLLLPILVSASLRTRSNPSAALMPMGFATLVGGMSTTIGTSTNLLVVAVSADIGGPRIGMFDFFVPAALAGGIGIAYLWLVAPRLLPAREMPLADTSPRLFAAYLSVPQDSEKAGWSLAELVRATDGALQVARIQRGEHTFVVPLPDVRVRAGDRLLVRDTPPRLKEFEHMLEFPLYSGTEPVGADNPLTAEDQQLAEIVVVQGSPLDGRTLRGVRFVERYQLAVLALHRAGRVHGTLEPRFSDTRLQVGDVLLVQGAREQIAAMRRENALLVLDATTDLPRTRRAGLALLIMGAVVALATASVLPISVSALAGALAMIATRCVSWRDAVQALSTPVILIVVSSLALGAALVQTGGARYLTEVFLFVTHGAPPASLLSGLMLVMAVVTNLVSNNAAAVIGTPIAIDIARGLGLPAEPFVLAVLFGANMSYATPMAYKTNLLVMNAGGYTFGDFLRVGVPLTLIVWLAFSVLLPLRYGF